MNRIKKIKNGQGFGLIEVLIAMIVLAIGLLGVAGLQVTGMQNNHSAYLRSQASLLAYDVSDKMRSNSTAVTAGTFDNVDTSGSYAVTANCYSATGCNSSTMATSELGKWKALVESLLPSGSATITNNSGLFTIAITWVDDRKSTTNTTRTFSTSFRP